MSIGLADVLPTALREEADIEEPTPRLVEDLRLDLKARRKALNLWPQDLAPLLGISRDQYRRYEGGTDPNEGETADHATVFAGTNETPTVATALKYVAELVAMEAFVRDETKRLTDNAPDAGLVVLDAILDQGLFELSYPEARTKFTRTPYPVSLQYVAVGRAAGELFRRGLDVEVIRGMKRFDLTAARSAAGLGKSETAYMLGLNLKSYYAAERGAKPPKLTTINDLQGIYDFITDVADELEVTAAPSGGWVVWTFDDQTSFETAYPDAVFERSGQPYPAHAMLVAAGRRASALEATGKSVHIARTV